MSAHRSSSGLAPATGPITKVTRSPPPSIPTVFAQSLPSPRCPWQGLEDGKKHLLHLDRMTRASCIAETSHPQLPRVLQTVRRSQTGSRLKCKACWVHTVVLGEKRGSLAYTFSLRYKLVSNYLVFHCRTGVAEWQFLQVCWWGVTLVCNCGGSGGAVTCSTVLLSTRTSAGL